MTDPAKRLNLVPKNIIVRMPNWLGDLIMATPILADLRNHWPEAKITAMCQGQVGTLLEADPHLNEIFAFRKPSGWIHHRHIADIIDPLRQGHYDLGILLTNSFSSAWWFWRGNVQNRVGYATHWRRLLLNVPVSASHQENQHQVVTYKKLLAPLGIPVSNTAPCLYLKEEELVEVQRTLAHCGVLPEQIIVGVNPGAAYGSAKCWLPERFRQVVEKLLKNPKVVVLFFGDKAGLPLVNDICLGLPERVINLAGKTTLRELMAFIHECDVFLTNDSGPMHMASALGIPLVALFGSTSDTATGPYRKGTVIHKHVECSPCYRRTCPIDFRCMKRIEVEEVYQELQKLIQ